MYAEPACATLAGYMKDMALEQMETKRPMYVSAGNDAYVRALLKYVVNVVETNVKTLKVMVVIAMLLL